MSESKAPPMTTQESKPVPEHDGLIARMALTDFPHRTESTKAAIEAYRRAMANELKQKG